MDTEPRKGGCTGHGNGEGKPAKGGNRVSDEQQHEWEPEGGGRRDGEPGGAVTGASQGHGAVEGRPEGEGERGPLAAQSEGGEAGGRQSGRNNGTGGERQRSERPDRAHTEQRQGKGPRERARRRVLGIRKRKRLDGRDKSREKAAKREAGRTGNGGDRDRTAEEQEPTAQGGHTA